MAQSVCLGVLESHLSIYTIRALLDNEYRVVVSIICHSSEYDGQTQLRDHSTATDEYRD